MKEFVSVSYQSSCWLKIVDFSNVPGRIISGLDEEMLSFVTSESSERFVNELFVSVLQKLENIDQIDKCLTDAST